jgi:3-oxoacyl-[acyl-carrier-protein] synthase II
MVRRVVVTGLGVLSPLGIGVKKNWEGVLAGRSGIGPITLFDTKDVATKFAGQVWDFRPEEHIHPKEQRKMDRFIQLAIVAAREAFQDAGLAKESFEPERAGAFIASGMGGLPAIEDTHRDVMEKGARRISPFFIPMSIPNLAAGQVSMEWNLKGPNLCTVSACASGAHAIGESARIIQRDEADIMVCGGAESVVCVLGVGGFNSMRALSTRNDDPQRASRPFDKDRDGFVMGEGAGLIILESYEHAKKRGARIYGEFAGYALNADAYHMSQPAPEGEGAARCMKLSLKDAAIDPSKIDYINAHGTSTPIGDVLETKAVKSVFGPHAKKLAVSSTKSMTGHLLGAAGGVEAIFSLLAIANDILPPTINLENPDPECDLDYVPREARQRTVTYALSNSFGFGGTNASLVFKKI